MGAKTACNFILPSQSTVLNVLLGDAAMHHPSLMSDLGHRLHKTSWTSPRTQPRKKMRNRMHHTLMLSIHPVHIRDDGLFCCTFSLFGWEELDNILPRTR